MQEEKKTAVQAMDGTVKKSGVVAPPVPGELPVVGERSVFTHTMQEDVARAKADPSRMAKEEAGKKPFAEYIPPPPAPPVEKSAPASAASAAKKDAYQEAIGPAPLERDQPFSFPEENKPPADNAAAPFQIYIPPKRGAFQASTAILLAVLLLLIAGGGFGYWWFFMKTAQPQETIQTPEPPPEPEPVPMPVIEPQPEPLPPVVIPEPQPEPPPIEPAATSTPPAVESAPVMPPPPQEPQPVPEPASPQAVMPLDLTVTIEIEKTDKALFLGKLAAENAKITAQKATLRYLVKLSSETEKRYLSLSEIGALLGFTVPETLAPSSARSDFIGYKSTGAFRYGFAASVSQKESMKTAAMTWERTMLNDLKGLYVQKQYVKPAHPVFSENTYANFFKRYINMPLPDVSLDWAISDNYFIAATSKEMIYAVLDAAQSSTPSTPSPAK